MAQVLLSAVKIACRLPAALRYTVGPAIAAIIPISPLNIVVYVAWLLGLGLTKTTFSKEFNKTWKSTAGWAFAFYFLQMFVCYFLCLFFVCQAASRV